MSTIVLRATKGSALTHAEGDANFNNLNTDKAELTDLASTVINKGASLIGINDAGGLITATTVEGALAENRAAIDADEAALAAHLADATDAHAGTAITNTPAGSIAATTVQAAINELDGDITAHVGDTTAAHAASAISNTPAGTIAATDVQAAINELDGDIVAHLGDAIDAHDASAISVADAGNYFTSTEVEATLQEIAPFVTMFHEIQPITASVGSNALTITLNPTILDFRSSTIGSGTVNRRSVPSAISVVVSSGSTLGTTSAVQSRLAVLAIDNAGTVELAVVNMAGANNLDETTLISTTAEGGAGAADSASTIYSTTARTNVPFRVVGFVESTQATAGTWATAPSTIQGTGGNAMTAMSSLGYGMTPSATALSTTVGTTNVVNSSGKPKFISVYASGSSGTTSLTLQIDGVTVGTGSFGAGVDSDFFSWVLPPGKTAAIITAGNNFSAGNYIIGG